MPTDSRPDSTPKWMLWTGRVLSGLVVMFLLSAAAFGLSNPEKSAENLSKLGYPSNTGTPITAIMLTCVIIYAIPRTSILGAILLTGYLGGATATHVRVSEPWFMPVVVGVTVWLGLFLRDASLRALIPVRK